MDKKIIWVIVIMAVLALAGTTFFRSRVNNIPATITPSPPINVTATSTFRAARIPQTISIEDSPLRRAIVASGDYLMRQQLANGDLAYQVNIFTNDRGYAPTYIRLVAGAGSLYTVCRVSGDVKYCQAGDLALDHYMENLVTDPQRFTGICLYTNGGCPLGGSAAVIDAIYKRWQATGDFILGERNLLETALDVGYFIVSMRRMDGGFYQLFDPHFNGTVDPNYFSPYFSGEGLYALLQLYEMTGDQFWLGQAREVNNYMLTQPVTEDYGHGYAFAMFARLDKLSRADQAYARSIADTVIAGEVRSLSKANSSISAATKIEALSALAQSLYLSSAEYDWLEHDIPTFITFVSARQLPANDCNFDLTDDMILKYRGGLFGNCEDPSIRIDDLQHWINGVTTYLEFESMIGAR